MTSSVVAQQRRSWNTGDIATFPFRVVDGAGNPIALLAGSPTYAIISPSGLQVETGPAQATTPPGNFSVTWTVPLQAELSTPTTPYRIEVYIVTARRHEKKLEFTFDVINRTADTTQKRDVIEAHLESQPYRAQWRGDAEPDTLTLECYYTASPGTGSDPIPLPIDKASLRRTVSGLDVVYYYDIPAAAFAPGVRSMFKNQFTLLWVSRDTPTAETMTQYQQVRVMKRTGFELVTGVRFMVDRFQHKLGTAFYISDGDICEALSEGLGLLNGWYPVSNPAYTDSMVPDALRTFWIMLSSWWMLSSQHMLAGTLAFNFCVDGDTWVRTEAGMYRIKHLNQGNLIQDMFADAFLPELSGAVAHEGDIFDLVNELSRVLDIDIESEQGNTTLRLIANEILAAQATPPELQKHVFPHRRLDTPLGTQTAAALWDLGMRYVHRLRTSHGYEVVGTHNHPVLTLTDELELVQLHLSDVAAGSLVALNANAEPDQDHDVDLAHLGLLVPVSVPGLEFPASATADLCTVLGYRAGTEIGTSPGDQSLMQDAYNNAFSHCFGLHPLHTNTDQHRAIARWLRGAGDVELCSNIDGIPWVVMAARKSCARWFLRALFEATGTYYAGEPTFRPELARELGYGLVFTCTSHRQQSDLQQLLLRFGVVSHADTSVNTSLLSLVVTGDALNIYADAVGFLCRGASYIPTSVPETKLPAKVTKYLRQHVPVTMLAEADVLDTYSGLQRYLDIVGCDLALADPGLHAKITGLLRDRWLWLEVVDVAAAGQARVYDPTLPITRVHGSAFPDPLTNLFFTNNIVTHNSGQSISLDQDITGTLDAAIGRLVDWLNTHMTAAKLMLFRQQARVGTVAVRPYRIVGPNARTYRMDSSATGSVGGPPNLQATAQILGILS